MAHGKEFTGEMGLSSTQVGDSRGRHSCGVLRQGRVGAV